MIHNEIYTLRRATIDDASACALIVDDWIEKTVEMPRLFDKHKLTEMIRNAIPLREVWVIGQPINRYILIIRTYYKFLIICEQKRRRHWEDTSGPN